MSKLINCKTCQTEMAKSADKCPKCGAPNKRTKTSTWIWSGFFLLIFYLMVQGQREEEEAAQLRAKQAQQQRQNDRQYFIANKAKILEQIKTLDKQKKWTEIEPINNKYKYINDKDLRELYVSIRTRNTLNYLKDLPAVEWQRNADGYKDLLKWHPNNKKYQEKFAYYDGKLKEKKAREDKITSMFSSWDGSHRQLVKYVKSSMNDPDSFDHVQTRIWDMKSHIVIKMTFRGKNAFNATVTNTVRAELSFDNVLSNISYE